MEREKRAEQNASEAKLLIVTASKSDFSLLSELEKVLSSSNIKFDRECMSCHRNPDKLPAFLEEVKKLDYSVIIAVANSVSNLPAIIGGGLKDTDIIVIGVGLDNKGMHGIDSLLSINTIPRDVPMANTGIGKVGLYNAGLVAAKIINNYDKRRSV